MTRASSSPVSKPALRPPWRVIALALLMGLSLLGFAVSVGFGWIDGHTIERLIVEPGPEAMVVYVVLVFCLELLWCPRMWGLLAGGLLFGPWLGAALSLVADMFSATFCFSVARGGGRAWVSERLRARPRARAAVELMAHRRGMLTVALLRLLPFHYTAVSYAAGLAGVSFGKFAVGTVAGAVPGAVLYNAVGDAARQPFSPTFLGGVAVLVALGVVGALWARRLWRSRQRLLGSDGASDAPAADATSPVGGRSASRPGGGAEGN